MKVFDLSKEQLTMLKQRYLMITDPDVSAIKLINVDKEVSDDIVMSFYQNTNFEDEDFGYYDERGTYSY